MAGSGLANRLSLRAPTDPVLVAELDRLEGRSLRVLQIFAVWGAASALLFALVSWRLGLSCTAVASVFAVWFYVADRWLASGRARRALHLTLAVIESAIPWTFLAVMALAEGVGFAIASWVPPMVFSAQIVAAVVRLRPRSSLVAGVLGGVVYPAVALGVLARAPEAGAAAAALEPATLIGRSAALLVVGVIGALVAAGLLRVYQRAETAARKKDLFGKYRLLRPIAAGGMGTVIDARYCPEGGFERRVAVKRIHSHLAQLPEFVDAFRREAEVSARLAHPNIVKVLDFGRVGSSWFLAMEYVGGMTLHALMARAATDRITLTPGVVGFVTRSLLAGLDHAHQGARGDDGVPLRIVHRDLCPKNVLLSTSGEVKISDFGLARALGDSAMAHTRVTGHAGYVAPEQARGQPVDVRADLFPVGVMLWELVTSQRLFARDNEAATLNALMVGAIPSVLSGRPGLDPAWEEVIARALARDPDERFASAREMSAALDAVPGSRSEQAQQELAGLVRGLRIGGDTLDTASLDRRPSVLTHAPAPPA